MSGGDGQGHNSGAQSTGGVNGSAGPGGASSGGGVDASDHSGWSSENNPWGGGSGSGVHWGGGSGNGNNGGQTGGSSSGVNLSLFPEAQASVAFGAPMNISLIDGMWGFSVFRASTVQEAVAAALAKLDQGLISALPYVGRLAGAMFGLLIPSSIAPDDTSMMSQIVTTLPAARVMDTLVSTLPTQLATVTVHTRITDIVQNERQHLAVVGGIPANVPVVDAKPTARAGVFTAAVVPGMPDIHIRTETGTPVAVSPAKGVTPENADARPAGFTAGGNSHEAIIRFPKESGQEPIYVSVTRPLTPEQVKQRQEEENRLQQAWNDAHPVEAAREKEYLAGVALDYTNQETTRRREAVIHLKNTPEGLTLSNPELHPHTFIRPHRRIVSGAYDYALSPTTLVINTFSTLGRLIDGGPEALYNKPTEDIKGAFQQWQYLVEDLTTIRTTFQLTEKAIADAEKQVQLQVEAAKQKGLELVAAQDAVRAAIKKEADQEAERRAAEAKKQSDAVNEQFNADMLRLKQEEQERANKKYAYMVNYAVTVKKVIDDSKYLTAQEKNSLTDEVDILLLVGQAADTLKGVDIPCGKLDVIWLHVQNTDKQRKKEAEDAVIRAKLAGAGVALAPTYTPEMVKAADILMAAPGALVLNRAIGLWAIQSGQEGYGVMTLPKNASSDLDSLVVQSSGALPRFTIKGAPAVTVAHLSYLTEIEDVVHHPVSILAISPRRLVSNQTKIEPGTPVVEMPVRGHLVEKDGRTVLELLATGDSIPKAVPVLNAERDASTGLDRITVPAVGNAPSLTILINPAPSPAKPSNTGNQSAFPVTPVHTGTEVIRPDKIVTTTTPTGDISSLQDFIYWQPDASGTGVEPVYVMLSSPYGETNTKGKYSGRDYNTDKAGGPIQNLDWKGASIDRAGVDKVKLHTGRFESTQENAVMIDRLEKILKGELQVTDIDKRYYTHEIREFERYRNLGIKDGEVPENKAEVWNNTHTATLEDYQLSSDETLLYTPEALNSQE